jgi:DNA-binding transcriptional MerR regulator
MTVSERSYLSIGEVLTLLQAEFPDVTISKIRFLESQGLIDPERTPSGYRKFYAPDIDRLRFILREQRERFLPLKVIRDRLSDDDAEEAAAAGAMAAVADAAPVDSIATDPVADADAPAPESSAADRLPLWLQKPPAKPTAPAGERSSEPVSLSFDDLSKASGLPHAHLRELEQFGMITGRAIGMVVSYGPEALHVAKLAAGFGAHGLEPRHLRMFKNAAEREAALYEQIVLPLVKQRNPRARTQAASTLAELARLGSELRAAMLDEALKPYSDR